MKIKRKLIPGEPGTKKWIQKYGDSLICVRYRYDERSNKKKTTVEIVVDESAWEKNERNIPANKIMHVRVDYGELDTARLVKAAGGRWNKEAKIWELAYKEVKILGLEKRIVKNSSNHQNNTRKYQ